MHFDALIQALKYSELSAHGIFVTDELTEESRRKLLFATNQALTDIYTRFPLMQKDLTIIQKSWISHYVIDPKYAFMATPRDANWYIYDSKFDPYLGDLVKIVNVTDESGEMLVMNSIATCKVVNTPAPNVLEIPNPQEGNALFVTYRAKHPEIMLAESEIHIPANWLPALQSLIAHKVYAGGTAQEHVMKSQEMLQRYEMLALQQRDFGMSNEDLHLNLACKFNLGGWA